MCIHVGEPCIPHARPSVGTHAGGSYFFRVGRQATVRRASVGEGHPGNGNPSAASGERGRILAGDGRRKVCMSVTYFLLRSSKKHRLAINQAYPPTYIHTYIHGLPAAYCRVRPCVEDPEGRIVEKLWKWGGSVGQAPHQVSCIGQARVWQHAEESQAEPLFSIFLI